MNFTIFRPTEMQDRYKRHQVIHYVWKTKIFLPLIWFLERRIKKFMITKVDDIPNEIYNRNFQILYHSFERGVEDWHYNFYGGIKNGVKDEKRYKELEENFKNKETCHWYKVPKFFLNLICTIVLEDTAYRELLNCVMMRMQGEMNRAWNPEIKHRFPLYISMHDQFINYFIEWMRVEGGGLLKIDENPPLNIEFYTEKTKNIKLNQQAVEEIEKLTEEERERFKSILNKLIVELLGHKRKKLCPFCKKVKETKEFQRGTADFMLCNECSTKSANGVTSTSAVKLRNETAK